MAHPAAPADQARRTQPSRRSSHPPARRRHQGQDPWSFAQRTRLNWPTTGRLCRRPPAKTSLDRVMCHRGQRDPVRYAHRGALRASPHCAEEMFCAPTVAACLSFS